MSGMMMEFGLVLIFSFLAALATARLGQSMLVGYILVGVALGPHGFGLVHQVEVMDHLSEIGVALLMFFLGIEFSLQKFQANRRAVISVGALEILLNLAAGVGIGLIAGTLMHLTPAERIFLAAITAFSSSGVVARLLFEQQRTARKESEILMGIMIFEDFFAVLVLSLLGSLGKSGTVELLPLAVSVGKAVAFVIFFSLAGWFLVRKFLDRLEDMESLEMFTALVLGVILLAGALALKSGLSSAVGAFTVGMLITSFDVEQKLYRSVSAFRDIFVTVFFVSFGLRIDPSACLSVMPLLLAAVPVSLFTEVAGTSTISYLSGFTVRQALSIGTSMVARGEYSMMYASLGLASGVLSDRLYQFSGWYVLVMTLLAPLIMTHCEGIHRAAERVLPRRLWSGRRHHRQEGS